MKKLVAIFISVTMVLMMFATFPASAAVWNGTKAIAFDGGEGTQADPYRIANAEQLAYFAKTVNIEKEQYRGKFIKLTEDILLNDVQNYDLWETLAPSNQWTPIGNDDNEFYGTFDGNGKTISGLYIKKSMEEKIEYYGLFGNIKRAKIINTNIDKAYIDITTTSTSTSTALYVGGISGYVNNSKIINCSVDAKIKITRDQKTWVGGIGGYVDEVSDISFVQTTGTIKINTTKYNKDGNCIGGICGRLSGQSSVNGAINKMSIVGGSEVGGIVGHTGGSELTGLVYNVINTANISGDFHVGGIVGRAGHVQDCEVKNAITTATISNTGNQTEQAVKLGYICGAIRYTTIVSNCYYVETASEMPVYNTYDTVDNAVIEKVSAKTIDEMKGVNALANLSFPTDVWQADENGFPTFNPNAIAAAIEGKDISKAPDTDVDTDETEPVETTANTTANKTTEKGDEQPSNSGCGSSVGIASVCVMLVGASGALIFRRRREK